VTPVAERLGEVRERIDRAGGDPERVTIIAVTKGFGPEAVQAARAAGLEDIGENRAQELATKWVEGPRWHFLGGVQRNKVRSLAGRVDVWQSVDRAEEGAAIATHAPGASVFVQVNVWGEGMMSGW
jgi:uncharacterized pyridoxal phosphate-containing UPF0001 family protein